MPVAAVRRAGVLGLVLLAAGGVELAAAQGTLPAAVDLRPDPTFRADPALELSFVRALRILPSGDLLLIDFNTPGILRLDPTGKALAPLARGGEGPGEVVQAIGLGGMGDTLWVMDPRQNRISYFSRELKFLRSEVASERCGFGAASLVADGRCLLFVTAAGGMGPLAPGPMPLVLRRRGHAGGAWVEDTVSTSLRERYMLKFNFGDGAIHLTQVFSDQPLFALSPDGRRLAVVTRGVEPEPRPPAFTVDLHDLARGTVRRSRHPFEPHALPRAAVDSAVDRLTQNQKDLPWLRDSVRTRLFRPALRPPVSAALLDDDGRLWLAEAPAAGDTMVTWRVLSVAGHARLRVRLPARVRVLAARGEQLYGVYADEDEVPVLVRYLVPAR